MQDFTNTLTNMLDVVPVGFSQNSYHAEGVLAVGRAPRFSHAQRGVPAVVMVPHFPHAQKETSQ